jgi:aubergine-like protein
MTLKGNFFKLAYDAEWRMYQYHVDFNPPVENKKMKSALLMSHRELIGDVRAFDGMILYLPHRLPQNVRIAVYSFVFVHPFIHVDKK